ncbi:hypothetical protein FOQG_12310 [Fusarium oxysporum f. sp. raphani 54005]|uniref:NACHT domain-containing protein n=1 Tax=Fusarium oxysporum f. sp. raphani 54005 TaxID=1089458 RepID=X0BWY6_FUSOX|nr:hypothetical protein FOQG_12310 [Fusarium oxysporum f. sp. raphani 54005]
MDPLSAFSLATGIVTFVDFGSKVLSQFSETRQSQSGRPAVLPTIEAESKNLSEKAKHARNKVATLQDLYPRRFESLSRLTEDCTRAEKQPQILLNSLTAKSDQGFKALKSQALVSVRGILKQGEINSLENLLKSIRDQIMMDVIMCISLDDRENITKSSARINTMDKGVEHLQKTLNDMKTKIEDLQPVFHNISRGRSANMRDRERIASGLWVSIATADQVAPYASLETCIEDAPYSAHNNNHICKRTLDGLEFKDMMAREGLIEDPFPETFQWLLEDEHPDIIQEHLRRWSGDLRLLTCKVYPWNPGPIGQKSQSSLLRTMFYQLLLEKPDLCPLVASKQYKYFQLAGTDAPGPPEWTIEELRDSVRQVVFETKSTHRLPIFIDGLDEYKGDLKSLTSFVKQLHSHKRIKLCISSRPWNVFRDEFKVYPSLRMELFTRPDIEKYVHGRMKTSSAFQELRIVDPDSVEKLEFGIIEKAEGVFLWVVLVVEKLITTARDNNDLHAIWKEFTALQPGLEDLYASMRRRMDQSLLQGASKMYQLLFSWKEIRNRSISAPDFWMAINCHDPGEPQDYPTNNKTEGIVRALERRVAGHTGGMLQVRCDTPKATRTSVDFLHRTVFDWLQSNRPTIIRDGRTEYDPSLVLASALVSRLRHYNKSGSDIEYAFTTIRDVFHFGRSCNNCAGSRMNLLRIIARLQHHELEEAIFNPDYTGFQDF